MSDNYRSRRKPSDDAKFRHMYFVIQNGNSMKLYYEYGDPENPLQVYSANLAGKTVVDSGTIDGNAESVLEQLTALEAYVSTKNEMIRERMSAEMPPVQDVWSGLESASRK